MSEASRYPTRLKFSSDLRRIREERGLTLEALHDETKIPLSVLQDFEKTGLFDNPMFNRVYLRSLVRTYASFVEISSKMALEGLDEALLDSYKGRLAIAFLDEKPSEDEETSDVEAPDAEAPDVEAPEAETSEAKLVEFEAKKPPEKPITKTPPGREKEVSSAKTTPPLMATAPPSWVSPEPGSSARRVRPVDIKERAFFTQWVLIVGAVFVFAAVIWAVLALLDRPDSTGQQQAVVVDTTAVSKAVVVPTRPQITIGDTLDFVVFAAEKVERLHIRRDGDARRPYWIEQGVAVAYPALDRIVLESKVDRIQLFVEGYLYPTVRADAQGLLLITRDSVQAFVDTITTFPVRLPVVPDTIRLGPYR